MRKIKRNRKSTSWKFKNGLIPHRESLHCRECEGGADTLHYIQVNVDSSDDGEYIMTAVFGCECGEEFLTEIKIDRRRYSYFRMKFTGEVADGEQIKEFI